MVQMTTTDVPWDDNKTVDTDSEYDFMLPAATSSAVTNPVEEWRRVVQRDNPSGASEAMAHTSDLKPLHAMDKLPSPMPDYRSIEGSSFGSALDSILTTEDFPPDLNAVSPVRTRLREVQLFLWRYCIAIVAIFFAIGIFRYATPSVSSLSWVCSIPVVRNRAFCSQEYLQSDIIIETRGDGEYVQRLFKIQSATFEAAFNGTKGASEMSLELFGAQMALSDLAIVVQHSDLPRKDEVGVLLDQIAKSTRTASEKLKKYVWESNKATDAISAATEEARYRISKAMTLEEKYSDRIMNAITLQPGRTSRKAISYSYKLVIGALETQLQRLRYVGELVSHDLAAVDRHLSALYYLIVFETKSVSSSKEDLLPSLWTLLGGNRVAIRKFDENLSLLKRLKDCRNDATAQVGAALYMLETESQELESLRSTISYPALVGQDVPMEVHLRLVNMALERMADSHSNAPERYSEVYRSLLDTNKPGIDK